MAGGCQISWVARGNRDREVGLVDCFTAERAIRASRSRRDRCSLGRAPAVPHHSDAAPLKTLIGVGKRARSSVIYMMLMVLALGTEWIVASRQPSGQVDRTRTPASGKSLPRCPRALARDHQIKPVLETGDTMTQDEFQPNTNQSPVQAEPLRRPMQTEQSSLQMSQRQASAPNIGTAARATRGARTPATLP